MKIALRRKRTEENIFWPNFSGIDFGLHAFDELDSPHGVIDGFMRDFLKRGEHLDFEDDRLYFTDDDIKRVRSFFTKNPRSQTAAEFMRRVAQYLKSACDCPFGQNGLYQIMQQLGFYAFKAMLECYPYMFVAIGEREIKLSQPSQFEASHAQKIAQAVEQGLKI